METIFIFIDTNVLIQCKPIRELNWSDIGEASHYKIILTRPIQAEIDSLKGKGSGRLSSRAKSASSLIREALNNDNETLILNTNPLVEFSLRHDLKTDDSVNQILNYDERDDQFVGTVLKFKKDNPHLNVLLLTNDTGPMVSAKTLNLGYIDIPDSWMLAPESDERDKKEKILSEELIKYKNLEPKFKIIEDQKNEIQTSVIYTPLSDDEVDKLIAKLETRNPICRNFGSKEVTERDLKSILPKHPISISLGSQKEIFTPATAEEIDNYNNSYREWLNECRDFFNSLHKNLQHNQPKNKISLTIENSGSRPSEDTLVIFYFSGKMLLEAPKKDEDIEFDIHSDEQSNTHLKLKNPPHPPKGVWKKLKSTSPFDYIGHISNILETTNRLSGINNLRSPLIGNFELPIKDANSLYFKKGRRGSPSQRLEYECEQWRHAQNPHEFLFNILTPLGVGEYKAMFNVEVHAANLTKPECFKKLIKIEVIEQSCFSKAEELINASQTPA